jgi:hypothetical protein
VDVSCKIRGSAFESAMFCLRWTPLHLVDIAVISDGGVVRQDMSGSCLSIFHQLLILTVHHSPQKWGCDVETATYQIGMENRRADAQVLQAGSCM